MEEVKIVAWLKGDGDPVKQGELIFEVETDKAVLEAEAPASGFLRIVVPADQPVPAERVVAYITTDQTEPLPDEEGGRTPSAPAVETATPGEGGRVSTGGSTPAARRRAQELGIDIATVTGTGPAGQITLPDVERAAPVTSGPSVESERRVAFSPMRRKIAERMTLSAREIPQFSIARVVDMAHADGLRRSAGVSYTDLIISACARSLEHHEGLRSRVDKDAIVVASAIHVGIAIATEDGLLVPVIRDANRKTLKELSQEREALEVACRAGKLPADAAFGAALTISNLGPFGVDRFTALVNPPEAAILAVGRVAEQVVAKDGQPTVRPTMTLTLSVDHRVVDGVAAAKFLDEVVANLEASASVPNSRDRDAAAE